MGSILDSSIVAAAQRARQDPADFFARVVEAVGGQKVALSAIGYTELVHGHHRCITDIQRERSRQFLDALISRLPIYAYTQDAAEIAGRIDAEQRSARITIPIADLYIGATALSLGFSVLTANVRHFNLIPGLRVLPFV